MTTYASVSPTPSEAEISAAKEGSRLLPEYLVEDAEVQKIVVFDGNGESIQLPVPVSALRLFVDILTNIGQGESVSLIPNDAELTTQQAAEILNVSRPYVVKLLEEGKIPFHKVGTHRRIRYHHLLTYLEESNRNQINVLEALTAQAQALDMGYE